MNLHHPWSTLTGSQSGVVVDLTPERAGWTYCGLRVVHVAPGVPVTLTTGASEAFVLPLSGGVRVDVAASAAPHESEAVFDLVGRESVFSRVSDFAYVGRDSTVRLTNLTSGSAAEVALPSARCERRLPPRYGPAEDVPVDVRGAGPATRQVTNFGAPGVWDHAERLVACELITPDGNWSSYPAHKHDPTQPCPVVNEEIYFFRIAGPDGVTPSRQGYGLHRTYTAAEHAAAGLAPIDTQVEVRDGDVFCIPYGYHGPCVAAPGYPMYYLNVLAGPSADRSMAFCDDAAHAWVRDSWAGMPADPRVPVTTAAGRHALVDP